MTSGAGPSAAGTPDDAARGGEASGSWHAEPSGVGDVVMQQLQQVGTLVRIVEQRLSRALGINPTDLSAMEHLMTDGPLTSRELADRLRVSTAASTHVVDRLERAGHISRRPHDSDGRKVLVVAEPTSVDRTIEHLTPLLRGVESLVEALDEGERATVQRFLGQVVDLYSTSADAMGPA